MFTEKVNLANYLSKYWTHIYEGFRTELGEIWRMINLTLRKLKARCYSNQVFF